MTTVGYQIPLLPPGEDIQMKEWGGPGVGWVDRKNTGRLKHRRGRRSWQPWFARRAAQRCSSQKFIRSLASSLGQTYEEMSQNYLAASHIFFTPQPQPETMLRGVYGPEPHQPRRPSPWQRLRWWFDNNVRWRFRRYE